MNQATQVREYDPLAAIDEDLGQRMSLAELLEELEDEGLTEADLRAIPNLIANYVGFTVKVSRGPQSKQWPDHLKRAAIEAAGGGDADNAAMSDNLMPKTVPCVKAMNAALSNLNRLKNDIRYTKPHPRSGLRRVNLGRLEEFRQKLAACKAEIAECAERMNNERDSIKRAAEKMLGARYEESYYDQDFTVLCTVQEDFPDLGVPPALRQFQDLMEQQQRKVQVQAAASVVTHKRILAEMLTGMLDAAVERLESRRVLDGRHEVLSADKSSDGRSVAVTYRDSSQKAGRKPERVETMSLAEFDRRVTLDARRKHWHDETMRRLLSEKEIIERDCNELGLGGKDLAPIFERWDKVLRGQTEETISANLKDNEGMRETLATNLGRLGDALIGMSVFNGQRDVIRSRCKSKTLNPGKA